MAQADSPQETGAPVARTFASHELANTAIQALEQAGIERESISVVTRSPAEAEAIERETGASEDLEETTRRPHPFADLVDWLGRVESVAVPGFGAVLGSGNLWQDVTAAGTGRGSITGALVGLGIPVDEAANFETSVFEGRVLVVVHGPHNPAAVETVFGPG